MIVITEQEESCFGYHFFSITKILGFQGGSPQRGSVLGVIVSSQSLLYNTPQCRANRALPDSLLEVFMNRIFSIAGRPKTEMVLVVDGKVHMVFGNDVTLVSDQEVRLIQDGYSHIHTDNYGALFLYPPGCSHESRLGGRVLTELPIKDFRVEQDNGGYRVIFRWPVLV